MSLPSVTAVMLVNGRPAMVARAVQSFMAQTYLNKYLLIWDTGEPKYAPPFVYDPHGIEIWHRKAGPNIGALRNAAIAEARGDVVVTMDSDDASHAYRIQEQVSLLMASGTDAVGFNQILFWDSVRSEAWLYTSPKLDVVPGGTLAFWRRTWEQKRFQNVKFGEDTIFQTGMRVAAVSGVPGLAVNMMNIDVANEPRFIAHIHGANTSSIITPTVRDWRRVPECDEICRERMKL